MKGIQAFIIPELSYRFEKFQYKIGKNNITYATLPGTLPETHSTTAQSYCSKNYLFINSLPSLIIEDRGYFFY